MATQHRNALPAGYQLDKHRIEKVLGVGGFGITYLARDLSLDTLVAIKEYLPNEIAVRESGQTVLPKSDADQNDYQWGKDRFYLEAQTLARFHHPNIVQVFQLFEANGTAYMVMRYEEGESLQNLLKQRGETPLTEADLIALTMPLLDGLEKVHAAGFLHRDIKPGNIYIRLEDESPVLLDFGAARNAVGAKSKSLTSIVTAGYAPFEQYHGSGNQGPWTDIYALGAVLYRTISGRAPVEAASRVKRDPLKPASEIGQGRYSDRFLGAIDWALAVDEEERPQNINDWRAAFEHGLRAAPVPADDPTRVVQPPPSLTPPPTAPEPRRIKSPLKVIGPIALVAILLGGLAYLAETSQQERSGDPGAVTGSGSGGGVDTLAARGADPYDAAEAGAADPPSPSRDDFGQGGSAYIDNLLREADADLRARRFHEPPGDNAADKYREVLRLSPDNIDARNGLTRIDDILAEERYRRNNASRTDPSPPAARSHERVQALLADARDDIEANRLTNPDANNAFDKYQEVLRLEPGNISAQRGLMLIVSRYVGLANDAIGADNYARADSLLDRADTVIPGAQTVEQARERLTEARRRHEATATTSRNEAQTPIDRIWREPVTGMEFVPIPAGCFEMGSPNNEQDRDDDEGPLHRVCLDGFQMGRYEVTNAEYRRYRPNHGSGAYRSDSDGRSFDLDGDRQPVVNVSWTEANDFAEWLTRQGDGQFRLPTEAEWEYAARAGTRSVFYWGNDLDPRYLNFSDRNDPSGASTQSINDGYSVSAPVGNYRPNAFGLYDMLGNAMEWCQDIFANDAYRRHDQRNPVIQSGGNQRVSRGGGWYDRFKYVRIAFRYTMDPGSRHHVQGFRLVRR